MRPHASVLRGARRPRRIRREVARLVRTGMESIQHERYAKYSPLRDEFGLIVHPIIARLRELDREFTFYANR